MPRKVEISHKTIVFAVFFILGFWLVYFIRDILLQLYVALLLMTIFKPLVYSLIRFRIPKILAILVTYVLVIGVLGGVIAMFMPTLVDQTTSFVNSLPAYLVNVGVDTDVSRMIMGQLLSQLGGLPGEVLKFTFSVFGNLISVVTVLVFTFYMLLSRDRLENQLGFLFGEEKRKEIGRVVDELERKLGGWARGQMTLMFAVGLGTYIGLLIIGIPFALPLAILAGLLEIVPFLGPIVSAIPSVLIGFGISPLTGLAVTAMAFLVHQLENYILVPKIMENTVGLSPLVILVALAVGARLLGITGILISIPFVITLQVLAKEYLFKE